MLIKYRAGVDMSGRESMIRALVAAGVEGLAYDDVRVLMVSADKPAPVPEPSTLAAGLPPLFWGVLSGLLAVLLLSYAALHWRGQAAGTLNRLRGRWAKRADANAPAQLGARKRSQP